jgi:hypothetical protein
VGRPLKKWPDYALKANEASVDQAKELERRASHASDALVLGDTATALRDLGEMRVMALKIVNTLVNSRIGKYEQGKESQWNQTTDEQTAQAITQVLATRHQ